MDAAQLDPDFTTVRAHRGAAPASGLADAGNLTRGAGFGGA